MAEKMKVVAINESITRGIVVNPTAKPTTPPPAFTSSSGVQVKPSSSGNASEQTSGNSSGQGAGNNAGKKE